MEKMSIKKNDMVVVLSGKDKGKRGKVLKVLTKKGKLLVDGVNIAKRHTRPRPPKEPRGGILDKSMPLWTSKVMIVCPSCSKPAKTGKKDKGDGFSRVCKKCGKEI